MAVVYHYCSAHPKPFNVVVVAAVGISGSSLSFQESGVCNRYDPHAHCGDVATVSVYLARQFMDFCVVGFVKAVAVKTSRQDQGLVVPGVYIRIEKIRRYLKSKAALNCLVKTACHNGYFGEVLPVLGPTENIQGSYGFKIFKTLGQKE